MRERLISGGYGVSKLKAEKVIFNKDTTILIMRTGKKYISRPYKESFDKEKGLLMCIAKSSGYTHSKIKRLLKDAVKQSERKKQNNSKNVKR